MRTIRQQAAEIVGSGLLEAAAGNAWDRVWHWSVSTISSLILKAPKKVPGLVMRFAIAAIYTNFKTTIDDDESFAKYGGFVKGDGSEKLVLRIERLQ